MNNDSYVDEFDDTNTLLLWITFIICVFISIIEIFIIIFLINQFLNKNITVNNHINSTYFYILLWEYIIDILSSPLWCLSVIIDPTRDGIITTIVSGVTTYVELQYGFSQLLLGINRLTSIGFPLKHDKVRFFHDRALPLNYLLILCRIIRFYEAIAILAMARL